MRKGMLYAASAFFIWGLFPLYFKILHEIPSLQLVAHRMLWSLVFLFLVLTVLKRWAWLPPIFKQKKVVLGFFASAVLLSTNWFVYIWAVNNGRVIDSSLGYFINPLVNVMMGYLLLKERLRPWQWAAISLAACGVLWLTIALGCTDFSVFICDLWLAAQNRKLGRTRRLDDGNHRAVSPSHRLFTLAEPTRQQSIYPSRSQHPGMVSACRADYCNSATPLCRRRTPHPTFNLGLVSIHRPQHAIDFRHRPVPRAIYLRALYGLCDYLECAGFVRGRRYLSKSQGKIGRLVAQWVAL